MSKLGRYSADRKKIENVSAAKTIDVADCGTVFTISSGTATAGNHSASFTMTLPSAADAGSGWWAKFIVREITGGDVTITSSAGDADSQNIAAVQFGENATGDGNVAHYAAAGGLRFDLSACKKGDALELICDGTNFYGQVLASGSAAVVEGT